VHSFRGAVKYFPRVPRISFGRTWFDDDRSIDRSINRPRHCPLQQTTMDAFNGPYGIKKWSYIPTCSILVPPDTTVRLADGRIARIIASQETMDETAAGGVLNGVPPVQIQNFPTLSETQASFSIRHSAALSQELMWVPEIVFSSGPEDTAIVEAAAIVDIVFVFHVDTVMTEYPSMHFRGMRNVYLIRFYKSGEPLVEGDWTSFPYDSAAFHLIFPTFSLTKSIWNSLNVVNQGRHKILGRQTQNQRPRSKGRNQPVRISQETWDFGKRNSPGVEVNESVRKSVKRLCQSGLKISAGRVEQKQESLRFETVRHCTYLIGLLGETAIADVRKRRPKIGTSNCLHVGDVVNCILFSPEIEVPYKRYSSKMV
jgi:hypothetical protein